jgi:hypothetical protein
MKTKKPKPHTPKPITWDTVLSLLPPGWEAQATQLKAFVRSRKFASPGDLLQVLVMHVADDLSLQEAAAWMNLGGTKISHMAIQRKLKCSAEWIEWMCAQMAAGWGGTIEEKAPEIPVHIVDATTIRQPGSKGTDQRVHLELDVHHDRTAFVQGSDAHTGETFRNFAIQKGTLYIGDRGYGNRPGIAHVVTNGGYVLVRINAQNLPLKTTKGKKFDLLGALRTLPGYQCREWPAVIPGEGNFPSIRGRVCAQRLDPESRVRAEKHVLEQSKKKGHQVKPETLEMAGYVAVFTTLPQEVASARKVLDCFRARWQVEIRFKRDKGVLNLGDCPKKNPLTARTWRALKLLCILLVEALRRYAEENFSPGSHTGKPTGTRTQPLAGMEDGGANIPAPHYLSGMGEQGIQQL